jgi:outer membrane protein assembly factor BamA
MYMPANIDRIRKGKITGFIRIMLIIVQFLFLYFFFASKSFSQSYILKIDHADTIMPEQASLFKKEFPSKEACVFYVTSLPGQLRQKGYASSSVDSFLAGNDTAYVKIYLGKIYRLTKLEVAEEDQLLLDAVGFNERSFLKQPFDQFTFRQLREKLLVYLENNGYPFAEIKIDSIDLKDNLLKGKLQIQKGPLYKIDSIRIFGDIKMSNRFLQRYLDITDGSLYRKSQLLQVDRKLRQLPYLTIEQPSDISYLGSGALLNVYLKGRKNSQINGLIGFLPAAESTGSSKLLITGDFNLNLKNGFGKGESILVMFQQIQVQSPRLKMSYQQPFLFGSPFGTEIWFEGFKKDSSFLNIRYQIGAEYAFGQNRNGKIFFQQFITTVDYIDTLFVKRNKRLPEQIDQRTTSIGGDYEWWNTDYRFNPRKGFDIKLQGMVGIRQIRKNIKITSLKGDGLPTFDFNRLYDSAGLRSYTFRVKATAARYFKTGRQTTLKTALNGGWVESPSLFRNELFQLGGFQLLRGFDDESLFASSYLVFTSEYRLLTGQNSFLYAFWDGARVENRSQFANTGGWFWGTGFGVTFDTKAGLFNVAFAVGKREELPLNLRQMKIHFGYLNFF